MAIEKYPYLYPGCRVSWYWQNNSCHGTWVIQHECLDPLLLDCHTMSPSCQCRNDNKDDLGCSMTFPTETCASYLVVGSSCVLAGGHRFWYISVTHSCNQIFVVFIVIDSPESTALNSRSVQLAENNGEIKNWAKRSNAPPRYSWPISK